MFDDPEPLPTALACMLVAMIDKTGAWQIKADIILAVASREGGAWWTSSEIADQIGSNDGTCRRHIAQLVTDHVLLRFSGEEKNARKFWVELNPDWESWRVKWRPERLHAVRQRVAYARQEAGLDALDRFIARPYGARYAGIIARQRKRAITPSAVRDIGINRASIEPRDNATSTGRYRAKPGGNQPKRTPVSRVSAEKSRVPRARDNSGRSEEEEDLVDDKFSSSPQGGSAEEQEEPISSLSEVDRGVVRRAVLTKCRSHNGKGPWIGGRPAQALDELVDRYGPDAVVEAVADITPGEYLVPELVDILAVTLRAGHQPPLPLPDVGPGAERAVGLRARLKELEAMIADVESGGYEAPAYMVDERDEIAARLAALEAESYDRLDG